MPRIASSVLACSLFLAFPAHAEKPAPYQVQVRGDTASYEVAFDDESLLAPGASPYSDFLKGRIRAPKAMLLRPRVSFVPELLTSAYAF